MGRLLFYKGFHILFETICWILGVLSGLVVLGLTVLTITLSSGPISLNFAIPYIENRLYTEENPVNIQLKEANLYWDHEAKRLTIKAEGVKLRNDQSKIEFISLPDVELRYKLTSLFKLQLIP